MKRSTLQSAVAYLFRELDGDLERIAKPLYSVEGFELVWEYLYAEREPLWPELVRTRRYHDDSSVLQRLYAVHDELVDVRQVLSSIASN